MNAPLRVLLIEDSEDDARLVVRELHRGGYEPAWERVESAEALAAALDRQPWDIVLCDHSLPGFNSFAALDLLKRRGLDLPFIIVSGSIGEDMAVAVMKAGAHDYVMKDRLARLAPAVERELREAETARQRKQTEHQLKLQTAALEAAANGIIITDRAGDIQWVNPAFCEMSGYTTAEVIGRNPRFLKSDRHDAAFYRAMWETVLAGTVWHGELTNKRKDGSLYTQEMTITPVRSAGREITHFVAIKRDITDRKCLEAQLRQAQKMEAVGRLAGGVAHDFNNMLTAILCNSDIALRRMPSDDPLCERLDEIKQAAERAAELTRQLLAFSRKQVLQPRVLDLNAVVADIEKMLRRLIGEDIILSTLLAPDLVRVNADPGQIEQVIVNLVVNARDAMPGGGRLSIATANAFLDDAWVREHPESAPGRHAMLAVRDTGCGMTAEVKAHLFEPFFTTKEVGRGTGLGLATVFGIIKQSGGHIVVESEPGKGSAFNLYLPATLETPQAERPARDPSAPLRRGAETILVVEDDDRIRGLLGSCLAAEGYTVLEASNGAQAFEKYEDHPRPIHLLITDLVMPAMGGRELARIFQPLHKGIKVLYISGYTDDALMQSRLLAKGAAFLQKPFTPDVLIRKTREVLDAPSRQ